MEIARVITPLIGSNLYVPAAQYAAGLIHGQPTAFSLGKPALAVDTAIAATTNAQATAGTIVAYAWTADSPFGRTLQVKCSGDPGAATSVVDIYGYDYLGQPMVERFTTANGSSAIQYGKKAFYRVTASKIVTASTNAVTFKVGPAFRLGLPYKGDLSWAKEGGVLVPITKRDFTLYQQMAAADTVAGGSIWFRSPCAGFVKTLIGTPNGGGSTNDPVVTVKLGGTAITGLTVTVDTSDTAGTTVTDTPTTPGYNANNRLRPGDVIEVASAAAASAKGQTIGIEITPTQFLLPDLTDPGTVATGDPRGTYEAQAAYDGSTEIIVGLMGDNAVNSSGNGGLFGLKHYYA